MCFAHGAARSRNTGRRPGAEICLEQRTRRVGGGDNLFQYAICAREEESGPMKPGPLCGNVL